MYINVPNAQTFTLFISAYDKIPLPSVFPREAHIQRKRRHWKGGFIVTLVLLFLFMYIHVCVKYEHSFSYDCLKTFFLVLSIYLVCYWMNAWLCEGKKIKLFILEKKKILVFLSYTGSTCSCIYKTN